MLLLSAANPIGSPFVELQSVDSTNKYAMSLAHEANLPGRQGLAQHGMTIFAHEQTDGKGQRGKKWSSEKGSNIAVSIVINPNSLVLSEQFKLSVCVAISIHEFFSRFAGDETKIKWPNDLYWRDRKAGGVLIENVVGNRELGPDSYRVRSQELGTQDWKWSVVGIGININQTSFPSNLPNPVSLKQITGKEFDPIKLAKELCLIFDKNFQLLITGNFKQLFVLYQAHLYKKDEKVKLKKGNQVFKTIIKAVSETGQLITHHSIEERFEFGEVEWIL